MTGTRPVVLVLDYPGYEQRIRVDEMLADSGLDLVPLMVRPLPAEAEAAAYVRSLTARIEGRGPVAAVVGYCMSAALSHEVVRTVAAADGEPPLLMLLDGLPCSPDFVRRSFVDVHRRFSGGSSVDPAWSDADLLREPERILRAMVAELTRAAFRTMSGEGLEPQYAEELARDLVVVGADWLGSLVAAATCGLGDLRGDAVLLTSRGHPFPGPWPGARRTETVEIDCARDELPGHPKARQTILDRIAAR